MFECIVIEYSGLAQLCAYTRRVSGPYSEARRSGTRFIAGYVHCDFPARTMASGGRALSVLLLIISAGLAVSAYSCGTSVISRAQ